MGMDDIDVSLLRSFVAVAETGRMTTAAKVVNRSQGAISQQIKRLEDLFRTPLFERHAAAVRLTRSGERLMDAAHSATLSARSSERPGHTRQRYKPLLEAEPC